MNESEKLRHQQSVTHGPRSEIKKAGTSPTPVLVCYASRTNQGEPADVNDVSG